MAIKISKVRIHHYRSITELKFDFPENNEPAVICGPNNVGKTNILRALNLFFNENFDAETDIPYHIAEGSRGQGYKTTVEVDFQGSDNNLRYHIKKEFTRRKGQRKEQKNIVKKSGYEYIPRVRNKKLQPSEIDKFLNQFWYVFVEASNINMPQLINEVVKNDVLSVGLDRLRKKQEIPLGILQKFIELSGVALKNIEEQIGTHFKEFVKLNDSIKGIKEWEIQINFPQFENLRDAISNMVTFTLYDSNKRKLDSKGSGIQRILFLSLVKYISTNTKRTVIWGLDEPEVFLQPGLQKEVFKILKDLASKLTIIFTTHSHHFIDLNTLENCYLLTADYEIKKYVRRQDEEYFKVDTKIMELNGNEKVVAVKKHMGIQGNDSWAVLPHNLLVEGEEDKEYLIALFKSFDMTPPNIFIANGVDKIPGYLAFLNNFVTDLSYKPKIISIFDHDAGGKNRFNTVQVSKYQYLSVEKLYYSRYDGLSDEKINYELEDFIYPEIIVESVNKILSRQKYKKIPKVSFLKKRNRLSFLKDNLLKILTNEVKGINENQQPLDFETEPLKLWICKLACKQINHQSTAILNQKYPKVKTFLDQLVS